MWTLPMWFTETPWPPIVILLIVAAILVGVWYPNRRGWPLVGVALIVVLCVGIYFVEREIVTDREVVEASVLDMVEACKSGDVDATLAFISPQRAALRVLIGGAMKLVDIEDDVHVTDLDVRMVAGRTQAISHFRANGTISAPSFQFHGSQPSRWELTWQKTGDGWKVIEIKRLSVVEGRELSIMDRAE
jgi:hypothetical protein